jgi:phage terminase Nu1 subunit (DNA packaging protein)
MSKSKPVWSGPDGLRGPAPTPADLAKLRQQNRAEIREVFDCSNAAIQNWLRQGLPVTMRKNEQFFNAAEVSAWLKDRPNLGGGPGRPKTERGKKLDDVVIRKNSALSSLYEAQVAKFCGQLVDVRDVERAAAEVANAVKSRLLSLPAAVAPALVGLSAEGIEVEIENRILAILVLVSKSWLPAKSRSAALPAADEDAAQRVGGEVSDSGRADG